MNDHHSYTYITENQVKPYCFQCNHNHTMQLTDVKNGVPVWYCSSCNNLQSGRTYSVQTELDCNFSHIADANQSNSVFNTEYELSQALEFNPLVRQSVENVIEQKTSRTIIADLSSSVKNDIAKELDEQKSFFAQKTQELEKMVKELHEQLSSPVYSLKRKVNTFSIFNKEEKIQ